MITLHALAGFSEDKQAARHFTRRFLPLSLGCVVALLCFCIFLFIPIYQKQADPVPQIYMLLAGASFVTSIALFVLTWRRMVGAVPISRQSKQSMEVYQLKDTIKDGKYELVYLCRQSGTFFRIVFKAPGD